ncbi:protein-glutamate methylesterase/protein-glutamine glutaminase [Tautonia plasticadhaerens]|uniref:Protein-glutamate methylesterase/protein-glutamine glutaminase n=1 Tax=Tautonia plasticadhaerens TaxID=2527974 RepID=A0A518H7P5_9BACT|nr:chemotaxis response regulator protein-glutamate methylesterase [Tautonia plasticadhaerens]QDV36845.1 Chemotaxis response regulator protein-glutamate methylesterase [Tautonia plasticadhaerens]
MMPDRPVRVLIVDDSALIRKLLGEMLRSSPLLEVVGVARDGEEALELADRLRPDVVTLDVEMPGLSGLEVLPRLLEIAPVPVIMVSSWTQEGADVTLAALELGAVDFLAKPDRSRFSQLRDARDLLVAKVLMASKSKVRGQRSPTAAAPAGVVKPPPSPSSRAVRKCVVLGISTGGPQTLTRIFSRLEPPFPPILVVQHMPATFTAVFANRLNRSCPASVQEATDGQRVEPDRILIAPGGRHLSLSGRPPMARVALSDGPLVSGHRPSVDVLFRSAAEVFGADAVGVMMTGMGRDGVEGCLKILEAGGTTLGQDEASSIIYGMNKAAFEAGAIRSQFSADELPGLLRMLAT